MTGRDSLGFRVLALGVMALGVWSLLSAPHAARPPGWWPALAAWLSLWLISLLGLRVQRLRWAALAVLLVCSGALARLSGQLGGGLLISLGVLGANVPRPWIWYLGPAAVLASGWWLTRSGGGPATPAALTGLLFALASVLLVGRFYQDSQVHRQQQARALEELRQAHAALAAQASQAAELARLRERSRLARELHDTLGHALSAIAVQLEAARRLVPRDPARLPAVIAEAQAMAREAMADLRRHVAGLRTDGHSVPVGALLTLAREAAARSGWRLAVELPPVLGPIPEGWLQVLREALTNVERHAGATAVRVALHQEGETLVLSVVDDGRGFVPEQVPEGHFGLRGMGERMAELGGELRIQSRPGAGAHLVARAPLKQPGEVPGE